MQWRTDHPHSDLEPQRAQLSAWLDGELEPAERTTLERHLSTCAWCQNELAALREVRTLVRALPTPRAPRSFLLPEAGPLPLAQRGRRPVESASPPERAVAAYRVPSARTTRRSVHRAGVAQWVGGLAAVLGLVVLGGSVLLGQPQPQATGLAGERTNASSQHPGVTGSGPAAASTPTPTQANATPAVSGPQPSSPTGVPLAPLIGGGLLGGGVIVVVGAGVARRTRERRENG
jgi:anti-sigma factor RsiW